jgi:hypothetical protein
MIVLSELNRWNLDAALCHYLETLRASYALDLNSDP